MSLALQAEDHPIEELAFIDPSYSPKDSCNGPHNDCYLEYSQLLRVDSCSQWAT